jgi:LCP family protein required for cell wall assembly
MSVVLFAVAALGYVLYQRYDGNISRIPGLTTALPGLAKPAPAPRDARNILLVGSDTRATTGERFQGEGAARTSGQRSDTVILAHLYGDSNQAQLVSFPRDSWVQIPAYTDPATGKAVAAHSAKLNSAIEEGGPALLIATIEKLTDIRVDNYIQIDFAGFQDMVETLGGVEVCLTHDAKESNSGIDLKAGRQTVNGAQALAFVRQRYELPNGDLDRIKRQQAFIASITRKLISAGTLLDPFKLNNFLNAATRSVAVDEDLSTADLTALAFRLRNVSAGGVVFTTVPFTTISARRGGQDVVLLDPVKDAELFDALRSDRPPGAAAPAPSATTAPLTVAPRAIRVSVYNGAGVAGLGRQVAQDLGTAGFVLNGSPGNRGTGATTSVIRYAPSRAEAARTLAAALPSATLEQDAALGSTIELVAGSSYAGLQPVPTVAGAAPSAPAAPPPRPAPAPPVTADADGCVA